MVIALLSDGTLGVYQDAEELYGRVEALDAEETLVRIFDESGRPLGIRWVEPNQAGRTLFGLIKWVANGRYELVPSGEPDRAALLQIIQQALHRERASTRAILQDLERKLLNVTE